MMPLVRARARTKAKAMVTSLGLLSSVTTAWALDTPTGCVPRPQAKARESLEQRSARIVRERATASRSVRAKAVANTQIRASTKEDGAKAKARANGARAAKAREKAKEAGAKAKVKESMA